MKWVFIIVGILAAVLLASKLADWFDDDNTDYLG